MHHSILLINSITVALQAQKLLGAYGISSNIKKITNIPQLNGCGYGLEVQGDARAALSILAAGNVRVIDVIW